MSPPPPQLAVVLATGELERLYSGLSLLVATAADGDTCAGLLVFRSLELLLAEDLHHRALEPSSTPALSWAGRETFASSLLELRDQALELEAVSLYACSASVETMGVGSTDVEGRLDGIRSTPRFLRDAREARLVYV